MSPAVPTVRYRVGIDEDLSSAIITAISKAKGRDVSEDSCALYDAVDPDALNGIFRENHDGDSVKVEFATHDAIVVLWGGDGVTIDVQDMEGDPNYGA